MSWNLTEEEKKKLIQYMWDVGFIVDSTPLMDLKTDEERFKAYGKHYLQRNYGKDFTERFINEGFSVEVYNSTKKLSSEVSKKYGLQNSGVIYLFTK